jgi:ribosomal-protein-alanine N-acetyltransferase
LANNKNGTFKIGERMIVELKDKKSLEDIAKFESEIFGVTAFSLKQLEEMSEIERYKFIELYEDEKIVGYVILLDSIDVWEIMKIAVDREQRKKGYGDKLLNYIFNFAQMPIMLEVRESNIPAIEFYRKNGFEKIGVRKNYYHDTNEAAHIMIKEF